MLSEPEKLYWVARVAEPELDFAIHRMKIREPNSTGSDPAMVHEFVKRDLLQSDGTNFFRELDGVYTESDGSHELAMVHDASDTTMVFELRVNGPTLNDTLRFDETTTANFFEDGDVLQVVDGWMTIRLEKDGQGVKFGCRSADDHFTIFEQEAGLIEELLLEL